MSLYCILIDFTRIYSYIIRDICTVDIDTRHQELGHGTCYKVISTTYKKIQSQCEYK